MVSLRGISQYVWRHRLMTAAVTIVIHAVLTAKRIQRNDAHVLLYYDASDSTRLSNGVAISVVKRHDMCPGVPLT